MKCFTPMVRCKTVFINKEFYDISGNDMHGDKYKINTF